MESMLLPNDKKNMAQLVEIIEEGMAESHYKLPV